MADDRYEQYHEVVRRVFGARTERVLADPAWPALGATLARVERAGHDPVTVLGRAYDQSPPGSGVRSVPALLTWRIAQELPARPGTVPDASARPAASRAATVPPTRAEAPTAARPGIPGWRDRPFGDVAGADLQSRLTEVRAEATRAAIVAREAREGATTALEVARSRRGPAVTALTEHHAQLSARASAIDALARLDREYREVRQVGGFGDQDPGVLRARLAVAEARLRERTFFGLVPAVRGEHRRELTEHVRQLSSYIEATGPRLAELDARRAGLEREAGPVSTREGAYREWLVMDRELPQMLDTARASDVTEAHRRHTEADRLTTWAQDRGEVHDQLVTEAATRKALPEEEAKAEQAQRASAAAEAVAAVAVAAVTVAAAAATVEAVGEVVGEAYEAVAEVEAGHSRSV